MAYVTPSKAGSNIWGHSNVNGIFLSQRREICWKLISVFNYYEQMEWLTDSSGKKLLLDLTFWVYLVKNFIFSGKSRVILKSVFCGNLSRKWDCSSLITQGNQRYIDYWVHTNCRCTWRSTWYSCDHPRMCIRQIDFLHFIFIRVHKFLWQWWPWRNYRNIWFQVLLMFSRRRRCTVYMVRILVRS